MEAEATTNENIEYEIFTKEIYESLFRADGIENIDIQHNIKLAGRSGCMHQIDVYWEFKLAGETHRVALECKNYNKEVSIAKVRDFFGVLYDVGNIKGIFVSKKGFQSGVKLFADYYAISLKEVRFPEEEDWKGRLKTLHLNIHIMPRKIKGIYIEPDIDWLIENKMIDSINDKEKITFPKNQLNSEVFVYNEGGSKIHSIIELQEKLPHEYKEGKDLQHAFSFDNAYVESDLGRIKIKFVGFVYDIENVSSELILEAEETVKAIIKDVKSGEIQFVNTDGSVR
ncbi:MAG: restriction endonuclease [Chitinophagaceae bacterium]